MSLWKVARDCGVQIARELNLRKSSENVHPQQRRAFGKAIADMAQTPDAPSRSRIDALYRQVPRRRELQTAVALLDLAWRIPENTRLEEDVVWMIRRCYLDAPRESWRLAIRDELRDRQTHPFPAVRRIVRLVRQINAADEAEIPQLLDLERGYPDLRQSIAERVILQNQTDYLEPLIVYLSDAVQGKSADPEEEKTARLLFRKLAENFQKDERVLAILYRQYLMRYDEKGPRGFLMLTLAIYGDAIVPQLEIDHGSHPESRPAIEHVLMQMVMRAEVRATEALLTLLRDAHSPDVARTASFLGKALATLAGYSEQAPGAAAVRQIVVASLPALERRPLPEIRAFLNDFMRLEWGQANVDSLVDVVIDGSMSEAQRQQLRRMARPAALRLIEVAKDEDRAAIERRRSLEAIALLKPAASPELASKLWTIFTATELDDVRFGVLRALEGLEIDPGPQARGYLFALIQTGSPELVVRIRQSWNRIFRAASLDEVSVTARSDLER